MPVYVDGITDYTGIVKGRVARAGTRWSHMTADTLEELHAMAAQVGMRREWFQPANRLHMCHYDLVPTKRARAIALGAIEVNSMQRMRDLRDAGRLNEPSGLPTGQK